MALPRALRFTPAALATLAVAQLAATGCGPSWPTVRGLTSVTFVAEAGVPRRIDLLPIDVEVGVHPSRNLAPTIVEGRFDLTVRDAIEAELARKGHTVRSLVGWTGGARLDDGTTVQALTEDELRATLSSLASFGLAQATARGGTLLQAYLPVRLGTATGADSTLYVGGWTFAGEPGTDTGDVLKGIFIAVIIVVVVAAVLIGLDRGSKGSKGSKGSGGAGRAAGSAARAVARGVGNVALATARGVGRVAWVVAHGSPVGRYDAWGNPVPSTHLQVMASHPPQAIPATPAGGRSRTLLEMTLVDNRTGQTLWHARDEFPADPMSPPDVQRMIRQLLGTLP